MIKRYTKKPIRTEWHTIGRNRTAGSAKWHAGCQKMLTQCHFDSGIGGRAGISIWLRSYFVVVTARESSVLRIIDTRRAISSEKFGRYKIFSYFSTIEILSKTLPI